MRRFWQGLLRILGGEPLKERRKGDRRSSGERRQSETTNPAEPERRSGERREGERRGKGWFWGSP
ncbi:MAG TPA: hypothetical protein VMG58_17755 [Candidatus Sulfotelmatobacter sp.]|nr:hypothetical protein [Candidatus Sulfotelmatobacter sp.]